jgi:hypothetical protein
MDRLDSRQFLPDDHFVSLGSDIPVRIMRWPRMDMYSGLLLVVYWGYRKDLTNSLMVLHVNDGPWHYPHFLLYSNPRLTVHNVGISPLPSDFPGGVRQAEEPRTVERWRGFPRSLTAKHMSVSGIWINYHRNVDRRGAFIAVWMQVNALEHGFSSSPLVNPRIRLFRRGRWPTSCFRSSNYFFFFSSCVPWLI